MNALTFASLAQAQAVQAQVDAALGMPLAGRDIGAGVHVPPAQSVTTTYFAPVKHPTLTQWAYLVDAVTTPHLTAPQLAIASPLSAAWTPASTGPTASVSLPTA